MSYINSDKEIYEEINGFLVHKLLLKEFSEHFKPGAMYKTLRTFYAVSGGLNIDVEFDQLDELFIEKDETLVFIKPRIYGSYFYFHFLYKNKIVFEAYELVSLNAAYTLCRILEEI